MRARRWVDSGARIGRTGLWAILPFAHVSGIAVRWRHLAPLALVLGLASSAAAAASTGIGWLAWSVAAPYVGANVAASAHAAWKERSPALAFRLPVVFASLHLAYGLGSLWGCVRLAVLLTKAKPQPMPEVVG